MTNPLGIGLYTSSMSMAEASPHCTSDFTQLLTRFQGISGLIAMKLDRDMVLDRIVNDIAETTGSGEVSIWLREHASGELVLQGVCGCTQYRKGHRLNAGRALVGLAAISGQMRYAPDVLQEPLYVPCEPAMRSELCIPLKANAGVIGVLCIDHEQLDAFSSHQLTTLQALARLIAIGIENGAC